MLSTLALALTDLKNTRAFSMCQDCTHFTSEGDGGFYTCIAAEIGTDEICKLCGSYYSRCTPHIFFWSMAASVPSDQIRSD